MTCVNGRTTYINAAYFLIGHANRCRGGNTTPAHFSDRCLVLRAFCSQLVILRGLLELGAKQTESANGQSMQSSHGAVSGIFRKNKIESKMQKSHTSTRESIRINIRYIFSFVNRENTKQKPNAYQCARGRLDAFLRRHAVAAKVTAHRFHLPPLELGREIIPQVDQCGHVRL